MREDTAWLKRFSRNLRKRLLERDVTVTDLARKTRIPRATIDNYYHGRRMPSAFNWYKIASCLDMGPDDLVKPVEDEELHGNPVYMKMKVVSSKFDVFGRWFNVAVCPLGGTITFATDIKIEEGTVFSIKFNWDVKQ